VNCALFGYMAYDSVRYFEDIEIPEREHIIPDIQYKLYRYVIVVDHFSNELSLFEHAVDEGEPSALDRIEQVITSNRFATYPFAINGSEESNYTNEEFLRIIEKGDRKSTRLNSSHVK